MTTLHTAVSVLALLQFTLEALEYVVSHCLTFMIWLSMDPQERASPTAASLYLLHATQRTRIGRTAFALYVLTKWWRFPLYVVLAARRKRGLV